MRKIALIYHFYEVSEEHSLNLEHFLASAVTEEIDYYFMLASDPSFSFPVQDNILVTTIPNMNRDIGGYVAGYKLIKEKSYDYIFFINSGTGGPFLREEKSRPWYEYFLDKLNGDTHLIGTSINDLPRPIWWSSELDTVLSNCPFRDFIDPDYAYHVQTGFFCITNEALQYLGAIGFFDQEFSSEYFSLVGQFEITLSQLLLHRTEGKAWNITSIQDEFLGIDFRKRVDLKIGDPYWGFEYFGRRLDPYEFIFLKTARGDLNSTELAELRTIDPASRKFPKTLSSTFEKSGIDLISERKEEAIGQVNSNPNYPKKFVISTEIYQERLTHFFNTNDDVSEAQVIMGMNALKLDTDPEMTEIFKTGTTENCNWPKGSICCGLAHFEALRTCVELGEPVTIFEDDAILVSDFDTKSKDLLGRIGTEWDIVQWGYNWDSFLDVRFQKTDKTVFRVQPIKEYKLNSEKFQDWGMNSTLFPLVSTFGMHAYTISPSGAKKILEFYPKFTDFFVDNLNLLGHSYWASSLDMVLNAFYDSNNCFVALPPLSYVVNDKQASAIWNPPVQEDPQS